MDRPGRRIAARIVCANQDGDFRRAG